jgi:hypothetical protein
MTLGRARMVRNGRDPEVAGVPLHRWRSQALCPRTAMPFLESHDNFCADLADTLPLTAAVGDIIGSDAAAKFSNREDHRQAIDVLLSELVQAIGLSDGLDAILSMEGVHLVFVADLVARLDLSAGVAAIVGRDATRAVFGDTASVAGGGPGADVPDAEEQTLSRYLRAIHCAAGVDRLSLRMGARHRHLRRALEYLETISIYLAAMGDGPCRANSVVADVPAVLSVQHGRLVQVVAALAREVVAVAAVESALDARDREDVAGQIGSGAVLEQRPDLPTLFSHLSAMSLHKALPDDLELVVLRRFAGESVAAALCLAEHLARVGRQGLST